MAMPTRTTILVTLCVLLSGCASDPRADVGFDNRTQHSDTKLWNLWRAAQRRLASQIDLNPLQRQLNKAEPNLLPGDSRATMISPRKLLVSAQPDVPAATLRAATGMTRSDPTGLISCPQPCNVNYAPAYSVYGHPASHYAASWEFAGNNFDRLVQYEFENQILKQLGYDMTWR